MGGAGRTAAAVAGLALAAIATATAAGNVGAQPSGVVALSVTPSTELVDGQVVTVDGEEFVIDGDVRILQCVRGAALPTGSLDESGCDPSTTVTATADAEGSFSSPFEVAAVIQVLGEPVDCVVLGACEVVAVNASNSGPPSAGVAIEFAGALAPTTSTTTPPAPVAPVAVDPAFTG